MAAQIERPGLGCRREWRRSHRRREVDQKRTADEVAKGRIEVVHLRTLDMPADILTKSLPKPKVLEMVKMLGLGT